MLLAPERRWRGEIRTGCICCGMYCTGACACGGAYDGWEGVIGCWA